MKKRIEYIVEKVKEYSKVRSLSGRESNFLKLLKSDMGNVHAHNLVDNMPESLLYKHKSSTPWLVTCHVDRIPVGPFEFELSQGHLYGQLDNVISVAIARYLIEEGYPVNVMFITHEEDMRSGPQIKAVLDTLGKDYKHIDMDIDVPTSPDEVKEGALTLRDHDICVNFYLPLVGELRKLCKDNNINFITKDKDWLLAAVTSTIQEKPDAKSCYLGLPINRYHSNEEEVNLVCVENVIRLFDAIKAEQK